MTENTTRDPPVVAAPIIALLPQMQFARGWGRPHLRLRRTLPLSRCRPADPPVVAAPIIALLPQMQFARGCGRPHLRLSVC